MNIDGAINDLYKTFPIPGYIGYVDKRVYRHVADTCLRFVPIGGTILDFGSGPCDKTVLLQKLGFQCTAYDDLNDPWHKIADYKMKIINFAKENGIQFIVGSEGPISFPENSFDMIMMHDILEHFHHSPRDILNQLIGSLKAGGLLFITVPNIAMIKNRIYLLLGRSNLPKFRNFYWMPGDWRGHIREYSKQDLLDLSGYLGLDVLELYSINNMLPAVPPVVRPIYLLCTSIFRNTRDTWSFIAKKPEGWRPKSLKVKEIAEILSANTPISSDEFLKDLKID